MRIGAVDLGSNSLKYAVAEIDGDALVMVDEGERLVRVGEGLEHTGLLSREAIERTVEGLEEIRQIFREFEVRHETAVATAGLRGALGAGEVVERALGLGFSIEIIDGDVEAALSFVGPARLYGPGPVAVFDVGGRSTEIIVGTAEQIDARVSLPLGGVRLTERFLTSDPPALSEIEAIRRHVGEVLAGAPTIDPSVPLVGVAGTALALFGHAQDIAFMPEVIRRAEGRRLTVLEVTQSLEALRVLAVEDRYLGDVIPPRRADVIVAGAALVAGILAHYQRLYFLVSARDLRYGLLDELKTRLTA